MDSSVALVQCQSYDAEQTEAAVRRAVDLVGGIGSFVKPGQRVLVKPNLLVPSEPARAIVTHPSVVRAVVRLVQGVGGHVVIADNPVVVPVTEGGWVRAYERSGLAEVAAETGAQLNMSIVPQQRPNPDGKLVKLVDVSSFVTEADVVISVPKLKTHGLMRFTGAVKNLFGVVPGATKFGYHVKLGTVEFFAEMLLDLVAFVRPVLTVMDAVVGMDGDGPSAGRPFPIGAVLAAPDSVALDVAALGLVCQIPASVPTVACAITRGWTTGRTEDLTLPGDALDKLQVCGFRMPLGGQSAMDRAPRFVRQLGVRQLVATPFVSRRCIGCGLCVENCPAATIVQEENRARIVLSHCIRCYCCHEMCPEQAIELRQPILGQALARISR